LANYLNYPNAISRNRHPFKSIGLQILIFIVLFLIGASGLYLYHITTVTGDEFKQAQYLNGSYHHINHKMAYNYPFASTLCIGTTDIMMNTRYHDSTLEILTDIKECILNRRGFYYKNETECIFMLRKYDLNLTFWGPIILDTPRKKNNNPVTYCALNMRGEKVTCGYAYYIPLSYTLTFVFNTVDLKCMDRENIASFIVLLVFAFIGSTSFLWGLVGYCNMKKRYCYVGCGVGLLLYALSVLSIYIIILVRILMK
jgi:hypothetical protein